jgi:outer membrane immunogenic protein
MRNANNSFSEPAGFATVADTISQNIDMVTVRVNYKFGGPVVAPLLISGLSRLRQT